MKTPKIFKKYISGGILSQKFSHFSARCTILIGADCLIRARFSMHTLTDKVLVEFLTPLDCIYYYVKPGIIFRTPCNSVTLTKFNLLKPKYNPSFKTFMSQGRPYKKSQSWTHFEPCV